jgi:DNA-binding transcriptional ArsR family regulator
MQDNALSRPRRIGNARVAAAFANPLRRRLVLLLAKQERSLTELASISGLELKRLHYHVIALQKMGLLVVTREQRRAGRPVKIYRAIAEAFFVPENVMPSGSGAALTIELRESLDKLRDRSRDGVIYDLAENGEPRMRAVQNSAEKPIRATEYWRLLKLSRAEALHLARDIDDCLAAYAQRQSEGHEPYLLHFAFAPRRMHARRRSR